MPEWQWHASPRVDTAIRHVILAHRRHERARDGMRRATALRALGGARAELRRVLGLEAAAPLPADVVAAIASDRLSSGAACHPAAVAVRS